MQVLNDTPRVPRAPLFRRIKPAPFQITERDIDVLEAVSRHTVVQQPHLGLLFPDASVQNLRRRLKHLFHAGLVARPEAQIANLLQHQGSRALAYLLTQDGATYLAERRGIRFALRPDDIKLGQLAHTLETSDLLVASDAACRISAHLAFEPFTDLLERSPPSTRAELDPAQWTVDINYRGQAYTFHVRPDAIYDVCHKEAAGEGDPRARENFFLEVDRGSMPIVRPDLYQTSILRKYLCYAETHRADIHRDRFGMNNLRVLFVGKSRRRIDAMIRAFGEHMTGLASPRLFLFADRPTLFAEGTSFFDYRWRDGEGKEHSLFE